MDGLEGVRKPLALPESSGYVVAGWRERRDGQQPDLSQMVDQVAALFGSRKKEAELKHVLRFFLTVGILEAKPGAEPSR